MGSGVGVAPCCDDVKPPAMVNRASICWSRLAHFYAAVHMGVSVPGPHVLGTPITHVLGKYALLNGISEDHDLRNLVPVDIEAEKSLYGRRLHGRHSEEGMLCGW